MNAVSTPQPGEILCGRYRIGRVIGQGGMSAVLEATHTLTGKRVAIKWLSPLLWGDQGKARFLREARASSRVRHPNVVDVYDFVDEDDRSFLVMELLEGEPLSALLARGGTPLHQIVALLIEAMRGVAAAHAHGVIHRDIKPDNIFLEKQLDRATVVPKVIDFGVSKLVGDALSLTQSGATLGTPMYMSYEQLRGAKDVDVRADVYSFGVILYEAISGQTPYDATSLTELVVKITTTVPPRLKSLRPDLPTALDHLVHWAMAIDRDQRLPSIDALIQELEPFASEHSFRAQMTLDGASIPRGAPASDAPMREVEEPITERRKDVAVASRGASSSASATPAVQRSWMWLVGGLIAVLLAIAWVRMRSPTESGASAPGASGTSISHGEVAPATASTPATLPVSELTLKGSIQAPVPKSEIATPPSVIDDGQPKTLDPAALTPDATKTTKKPARKPSRTDAPQPGMQAAPQPGKAGARDGFRAGPALREDF